MKKIHLGYKAFDIHELACHFVAAHAGLYSKYDISIELIDTISLSDQELPDFTLQSACGSALINWLHGATLKVVFIAAERPMFWLYGRPDVTGIEALRGRCIAGFPPSAPPAYFLAMILRGSDIAPGVDVTVTPARNDATRLDLLETGEAAAAVVSSATLPDQVERMGLRKICFFGDALRIPTTGLAVDRALLNDEPELVDAMVRCFRDSLRMIREEPDVLRDALTRHANISAADVDAAGNLIRSCYTADGRCENDYLRSAIDLLRQATGTAGDLPAEELYRFR